KIKAKELISKAVMGVMKEIRFFPNTEDLVYYFKLMDGENFLKDGDKVKAYVFFRGRQIVFKDQGEILLLRFATDLEEWGKVEQMPKLEGKRMIMILAPKPKK
uniref:translation initiation factor IF-3 n=1 Tax=Alistipes indistinctus TaxID=626932 RepID=UPI0040286432